MKRFIAISLIASAAWVQASTVILTGQASTANPLSQFAATTSAQLAGVLSDETGFASGALAMFSIGPVINGTSPILAFNNGSGRTGNIGVQSADNVPISGVEGGRLYLQAGAATGISFLIGTSYIINIDNASSTAYFSINANPLSDLGVNLGSASQSWNSAYLGTLRIKSGTNLKSGTFTLVSGTKVVANTSVTANSVIIPTLKTVSGTRAGVPDCVPTAGVGFTATGAATDNGTYNFVVVEVN